MLSTKVGGLIRVDVETANHHSERRIAWTSLLEALAGFPRLQARIAPLINLNLKIIGAWNR
jgi:hypothetical protein